MKNENKRIIMKKWNDNNVCESEKWQNSNDNNEKMKMIMKKK